MELVILNFITLAFSMLLVLGLTECSNQNSRVDGMKVSYSEYWIENTIEDELLDAEDELRSKKDENDD